MNTLNRNTIQNSSDNDFVGMPKEQALEICSQRGLSARITRDNGQSFIVTMDYRMDRINFHIENNVVVSQKRG